MKDKEVELIHARVFLRNGEPVVQIHIVDDQPEVIQAVGALMLIKDLVDTLEKKGVI